MIFTKDQQNALDIFIDFLVDKSNKYMVLQGASGTGKSTLIKEMVRLVLGQKEMYKVLFTNGSMVMDEFDTVLTATTNPAAAVLENLVKERTSTVHSFLGLKLQPNYKIGGHTVILGKNASRVRNKIIIIDEASMIDNKLMKFIEDRTVNCKIVLVGDWFQLAPVGQTTVTMQQISSKQAIMSEIMRNAGIIAEVGQQFRHTVETGVFKPIPENHSEIIHADGPTFQQLVESAYKDPNYSSKTARILAYTNDRVLAYSSHIREAMGYPAGFQVGERVITNKSILSKSHPISIDSEVEITGIGAEYVDEESGIKGRLMQINDSYTSFMPNDINEARSYIRLLGKQKNFKRYFEVKDGWLDLRLPYASTVHKAQGAEYDTVFIDLPDIARHHLTITEIARLLYVSITRAKKQVVLYGKLPIHYGGI